MRKFKYFLPVFFIIIISLNVCAHVPYLEHVDFSEEKPFVVRKSILQSIAVYSWLERDNVNPSKDIDVFEFKVRIPNIQIYIELIGPVCDGYYEDFVPWFALVGPGLSEPGQSLPFELPNGYGAIVKENVEPSEEREQFYEPFGGKDYYEGPTLDILANKTGTYYVYVWDPYELGGDYVAVLGRSEIFGFFDILRALIYTPMIRLGWELHLD
jgi:hypothetical protein